MKWVLHVLIFSCLEIEAYYLFEFSLIFNQYLIFVTREAKIVMYPLHYHRNIIITTKNVRTYSTVEHVL